MRVTETKSHDPLVNTHAQANTKHTVVHCLHGYYFLLLYESVCTCVVLVCSCPENWFSLVSGVFWLECSSFLLFR